MVKKLSLLLESEIFALSTMQIMENLFNDLLNCMQNFEYFYHYMITAANITNNIDKYNNTCFSNIDTFQVSNLKHIFNYDDIKRVPERKTN